MQEYLRKIKGLKKAVQFSRHFVRKDPAFYFFSVAIARKRASIQTAPSKKILPLNEAHKCAGESEMALRENLVAIPLRHGKTRDYSGGLITQVSLELVHEAIHMRNFRNQVLYSQELPVEKVENLQVGKLQELNALVMFGGLLYEHFGHFLLESLGRLWAYDRIKHLDPYVFFLLAYDPPAYLETKNFAYQVFKGFGIPLTRIIFVKEPTRIKTAIIPSQKYGYGFSLRPSEEFMQFVRRFSYTQTIPAGYGNAEKIYVSRSRLAAGSGKAVGECYFEEYLAANGYFIFYPEKHTLYEQLTVYSRASKILFSDGSAVHACILLPDLVAKIAVISRRKDPKYDITEILDQFKGYKQAAIWIDAVLEQYQFGLPSWQCLAMVDWVQVSEKLLAGGFVDNPMEAIPCDQLDATLKVDMRNHIRAISAEPLFIDYMLKAKETGAEA
ncbi:MAG: glycosyltransferase 61 family protein [Chitinophagaceae bacterium]